MQNLDTVNAAVLQAIEGGFDYSILIVRCLKTGGRFISVRSVTPQAFVTGLKACAKDVNFGAYNSPILESIRKYGVEGHSIALHSSHKTQKQARQAKKDLVETEALKPTSALLNWNRPVKNMADHTDFGFWKSAEQIAEEAKAKRARARARAVKATEATTTEATA
jgi:hypothetical protein